MNTHSNKHKPCFQSLTYLILMLGLFLVTILVLRFFLCRNLHFHQPKTVHIKPSKKYFSRKGKRHIQKKRRSSSPARYEQSNTLSMHVL